MPYANYATPSDRSSARNLYSSDHTKVARAIETARVDRRFQQSMNPLETGVVPRPAYADMFQSPDSVESLSGQQISKADFKHNNMTPFFGSTMKGLDLSRVESFEIPKKQEVYKQDIQPLVKGLTNICGQVQDNTYLQSRIEAPTARNNEFPIAQQNTSVRLEGADLISLLPKPKTVDDLRVNPRLVDEGRLGSGAKGTVQPVMATFTVEKHRPETYNEWSNEDLMVPTRAGNTAATQRPSVQLQDVSRGLNDDADSYRGPAGATDSKLAKARPAVILQETQQLPALPYGAARPANVAQPSADDYGKANVQVYSNERTVTTTKTVQTNLTTAVKAAIAPLLDIFKPTRADFTIDSARPYGALQAGATIPAKATTYDPVMHAPRTTIKETTVQDTTVGNLRAAEPTGRAVNPEAPLATGRNTLELKEEMRNLRSGTYKVTVYDPDQVARTTHRETLSAESRTGALDGAQKTGAYTYVKIDVPNTQKQYVSDNEYAANPAVPHQDGYKVVQYTFVPAATQKQFVSDNEYFSGAGTVDAKAQVSTDMWHDVKNKEAKEALEMGRTPTASGVKQAAGKEAAAGQTLNRNPALQVNPRPLGVAPRANEGPRDPATIGVSTKQRGLLETSRDDRLDPSMLTAFYENPYTKPLDSVA